MHPPAATVRERLFFRREHYNEKIPASSWMPKWHPMLLHRESQKPTREDERVSLGVNGYEWTMAGVG